MNWFQSLSAAEKVAVSLIQGNNAFVRCLDEMNICNNLPEEQELIDCLIWNKLIPLFYTSIVHNKLLEEYFSSDFIMELKAHYRVSILKHLQLEGVFRTFAPIFKNEGIDFYPFKGIVLSQQVYATPSLRPMLDIDILVSPKNVDKAKKILLDLGATSMYQVESKHTMGQWRHIPPLLYRDIPIEIHQHLFLTNEESFIQEKTLTEKLVPETIYDTPCKTLSPEHHLFYLIYHLHKHVNQDYIRLIWLLDIRLFWEKHQQTLDIKEFKGFLDRSNGLYNTSLAAIQKILGIQIIESSNDLEIHESDKMVHQYLSRCNSKGLKKQKIKSIEAIRRIQGTKNKLLFITGRIFPESSYVAAKYNVSHKFLVPFCYPLIYASYMQKSIKVLWGKIMVRH